MNWTGDGWESINAQWVYGLHVKSALAVSTQHQLFTHFSMEAAGSKEGELICFLYQCAKIQNSLDPAFAESLRWERGTTDLLPNSCQESNFHPFFLCQFFFSGASLLQLLSCFLYLHLSPNSTVCLLQNRCKYCQFMLKFLFFLSLYSILSHIKQRWGNLLASWQDCLRWNDLSNLLLKPFRDGEFTNALGNSIA